jgi:hypothetical protein
MSKPLAKSLHTVTVLVRVAIYVKGKNPEFDNRAAMGLALITLGLMDSPDVHGLAEQAIKQLNKYS